MRPVPERPIGRALAACMALAAASLLLPGEPTYDPWAWIIWGREALELDLTTTDGPSWKPLPMLFTIPFAALGDQAAPQLWLVVARAGGILAIVMAFRLGARLAGPWSGGVAAVALAVSDSFVRHFWRGFSEGLLVGLVLWAIERHLDGRRGQAFALGVAGGLLRPEVWPFLGAYGAYLLWRDRDRLALVTAGAALLALSWFVPEYLGSGDPLRAASRALVPNLDSPAHAPQPWLEVFERSSGVLVAPVLALGVAAVVLRPGDRTVRALLGAAAALMVMVALMTQAGFAGNLRYVALPAAIVCVLAGVAAVRLTRRAGPWAAVALVALVVPFAGPVAGELRDDARAVRAEARLVETLPVAVAAAGGAGRLNACGGVWTERFQVPLLAWTLHRHLADVGIFPFPPGVLVAPRDSALAGDSRFTPVAEAGEWVVRASCGAS